LNNDFTKYQAQTSPHPLGMEVSYAMGSYIYDSNNKNIWICAGSSACTLGQPARVNQAIKDQLDKYSHVMVYGEYSLPTVEYCKLLASLQNH
jgi:adenosylmethionine-8-amino-7-oxononanoate aminotransferase